MWEAIATIFIIIVVGVATTDISDAIAERIRGRKKDENE